MARAKLLKQFILRILVLIWVKKGLGWYYLTYIFKGSFWTWWEEYIIGGQELKQGDLEGWCSNQDKRWCRLSWDGEKWLDLGYMSILKEEPTEFPNGLGMGYDRNRGMKDGHEDFGPKWMESRSCYPLSWGDYGWCRFVSLDQKFQVGRVGFGMSVRYPNGELLKYLFYNPLPPLLHSHTFSFSLFCK